MAGLKRYWFLIVCVIALLIALVALVLFQCQGQPEVVDIMATAESPGMQIWWQYPDGGLAAATRVYMEGEILPTWTLWDECELRTDETVGATIAYSQTFAIEELPQEEGAGIFLDLPNLWWSFTPEVGAETWCRLRWLSSHGEEIPGITYQPDWVLGPMDEQGFYLVDIQEMWRCFFPVVLQGKVP